MRSSPYLLSLLSLVFLFFSCDNDDIEKVDPPEEIVPCVLVRTNGIANIQTIRYNAYDSLLIQFDNRTYRLYPAGASAKLKFHDSELARRITRFENDLAIFQSPTRVAADITLYYPKDSATFNNREYIAKFGIADSDAPKDKRLDSLAFVKNCPFAFHIELTDGFNKMRSVISDPSEYYQIDSIKYMRGGPFEFAAVFRTYGHFKTRLKRLDTGTYQEVTGSFISFFETFKDKYQE